MDYTHPRAADPLAAIAGLERAQAEQARALGGVLGAQVWRDPTGAARVTVGPLGFGKYGIRVQDAAGTVIWEQSA